MRFAAISLCGWLCLATAGLVARAEELPDTSSIKELSIEEARRLFDESCRRLAATKDEQQRVFLNIDLVLDGLTTLPDDVARELARKPAGPEYSELSLKGLKKLSVGAAEALGGHAGILYLDGLTEISPEAAAAISKHRGFLSLDGITTLADEAAKPLLKTGSSEGYPLAIEGGGNPGDSLWAV